MMNELQTRSIYPESDGKPMADNTKQFDYIAFIKLSLDALFSDRDDVFVAGDLLWYPVEGEPKISAAPDVMVVFGRPKGDRGSFIQAHEAGIAPQVVFEILSPSNTFKEMMDKLAFYEQHGVEEYYLYNPHNGEFSGWLRLSNRLQSIAEPQGWTSPRLGVRFDIDEEALFLTLPNGEKALRYTDLKRLAEQERKAKEKAQQENERLRALLRERGINPNEL